MGDPLRIGGWHPAAGEVALEIPPGHPAYPLLVAESVRALSLADPTADKINLSANPQVASVPPGNLEVPAMPRSVRLSLTVTVPETAAREVYSEMAEHAAELMVERGATYTSLDATVEDEDPS